MAQNPTPLISEQHLSEGILTQICQAGTMCGNSYEGGTNGHSPLEGIPHPDNERITFSAEALYPTQNPRFDEKAVEEKSPFSVSIKARADLVDAVNSPFDNLNTATQILKKNSAFVKPLLEDMAQRTGLIEETDTVRLRQRSPSKNKYIVTEYPSSDASPRYANVSVSPTIIVHHDDRNTLLEGARQAYAASVPGADGSDISQAYDRWKIGRGISEGKNN